MFLLTMKELPATLILGPTGFDTLATTIWSASSEAFFTKTAASSLILVAAAGVPTAWLVLREHSHRTMNLPVAMAPAVLHLPR